jgi:betaine-aldehyde dehydrogenase
MSKPDKAPVRGVHINGQWLDGTGSPLSLFDPVTSLHSASVSTADVAMVDAAVSAANAALPGWRSTPAAERGSLLARVAALVEAERERLVPLQMQCNGKPRAEAELDVSDVVATFAYYAECCLQAALFGQDVPLPDPGFTASVQLLPVGVVGLIVPWNFPMVTTAWKLAPALAAGCTVVLKPSELTPLAEIALFELLQQAGLPDGVVNLVSGGGETGAALASHPGIAKLSFTGSNKTGQAVMHRAADRMARVSLELGGKSALVVLDDADLPQAVELAVAGAYFNAGQMCSATSRILVQQSLYPAFVAAMQQAVQAIRVGGPDEAEAGMGPLISHAQQQRVIGFIHRGVAEGGRLLCDGRPLAERRAGCFVGPTLFVDLPGDSLLWREEIFGPVACIRSFRDDAEAIRLANDSDYGLVATVVGRDAARSRQLAEQLDVGMIWLGTPQLIFPQTAWGGFKRSGIGRELGPWGLRSFQEVRHIVCNSAA